MLTYGRMPTITRRIHTVSFEVIPEEQVPPGDIPFKGILPSFCVCGLGARDDDCVFYPRLLSSWRRLRASRFEHCPFAFH